MNGEGLLSVIDRLGMAILELERENAKLRELVAQTKEPEGS